MYIIFYIIHPNLSLTFYEYYTTNNVKIKGIRKTEYFKYL